MSRTTAAVLYVARVSVDQQRRAEVWRPSQFTTGHIQAALTPCDVRARTA